MPMLDGAFALSGRACRLKGNPVACEAAVTAPFEEGFSCFGSKLGQGTDGMGVSLLNGQKPARWAPEDTRPQEAARLEGLQVSRKELVVVVVMIALILLWTGIYAGNGLLHTTQVTGKATMVSPPPPAPQKPAFTLKASALFKAYEDNEVAADLKYKGQLLEVTGTVTKIGKTETKKVPYLEFGWGQFSLDCVQVQFSAGDEAELARLNKGDTVTVRGVGAGYQIGVVYLVQGKVAK